MTNNILSQYLFPPGGVGSSIICNNRTYISYGGESVLFVYQDVPVAQANGWTSLPANGYSGGGASGVNSILANFPLSANASSGNVTLSYISSVTPISLGGTGQTTSSAALTALGGVSSASLAASLASYANLSGATFTGPVYGLTANQGTNSTQLASTAFVVAAIQSIASGLYLGVWNANTNSPTITNTTVNGTNAVVGNFLIVDVAGSTNINGSSTWAVGDQIWYGPTGWQRIANTQAVVSVNNLTGAITISTSNLSGAGAIGIQLMNAATVSAVYTALNISSVGQNLITASSASAALTTLNGLPNSANVVTNSNLAQMNATSVKGNLTGSTANVSDISLTNLTAALPIVTSTTAGVAPASGGGTTNFLRADGTWNAPAGGGTGSGTVNSASQYATAFYLASGTAVSGGQALFPIDLWATGSYTLDRTGATVSTAMTAAHASGLPIFYSPGLYLVPTGLSFTSGGIIGSGSTVIYNNAGPQTGATIFITKDTSTSNVIQCINNEYAANGPIFKDFSFALYPSITKTGGSLLALGQTDSGSTNLGQFARFKNVSFLTASGAVCPNLLSIYNSSGWSVEGCFFTGYSNAGIYIENNDFYDDGGGYIGGKTSFYGASGGIGVLQVSGGGLTIEGNVFGGGAHAYKWNQAVSANSTTSTTVFIFANNTCENLTDYTLDFQNTLNNSSYYGKHIISNNQMDLCPGIINYELITGSPTNGCYWFDIVISGNTITLYQQGGVNGAAINLSSCNNYLIEANNIDLQNQVNYGIYIDPSCYPGGGTIGINNITSYLISSILNNGYATVSPTNLNFQTVAPITITGNTNYNQIGVLSIPGSSIRIGSKIKAQATLTSPYTSTSGTGVILVYVTDYLTGWGSGQNTNVVLSTGPLAVGNTGGVTILLDLTIDVISDTEISASCMLTSDCYGMSSSSKTYFNITGSFISKTVYNYVNTLVGLDINFVVVPAATSSNAAITLVDSNARVSY